MAGFENTHAAIEYMRENMREQDRFIEKLEQENEELELAADIHRRIIKNVHEEKANLIAANGSLKRELELCTSRFITLVHASADDKGYIRELDSEIATLENKNSELSSYIDELLDHINDLTG